MRGMQTPSRWLLLLAGCAPIAAQETYDLSVRAKRGDRLLFVESTEQLLRVQMPQRKTSVDNLLRFDRLFLIEVEGREDDGSVTVQLTMLRVHGTVSMPMGRQKRFDSAQPTLPGNREMAGISTPVLRMLEQVDLRFRAKVDREGNAKGSFVASPRSPLPGDPETAFEVEKMERLIAAAFGRLPGKELAVGATWPNVQRTTTPSLPTVRRSQVRFAEATDDTFQLEWTGKLMTNDQVKADEGTASVHEGTIRGVQTLDRRTCAVLAAKTIANAELKLPGAPETKVSMRVQSTLRRGTPDDIRAMVNARSSTTTSPADKARVLKAQLDVRLLADAVRSFYAKNGSLPKRLSELEEKDDKGRSELERLMPDSWGNAYELVAGDAPRDFYVRSRGPDGKAGTADDIDSRRKKQ